MSLMPKMLMRFLSIGTEARPSQKLERGPTESVIEHRGSDRSMMMRKTRRREETAVVSSVAHGATLLMSIRLLAAQSVSPTPGSIQDLSTQVPLPYQFSFEQQIQSGTQGGSDSGNPFAYGHAAQVRPWLHYDGIPNTTITGSVSYIYYFTVPGTSYYRHPEWRVTVIGNLRQALSGGSLYEQIRFELLNFRASNGDVQHLPKVRFRFGQNLYLSDGSSKPYLGLYEEAIMQFPQASYSSVHFQGARFFAGYGFDYRKRASFLLGFKAEAEVSSSGSTVTLFYGPVFSIEYRFAAREINEKHKRTTAFKDF
jgi:hypothetical protein